MSENEELLDDLVRVDEKPVKKKKLNRRFKLKPKRVLIYLMYFILILLFMLIPVFIIVGLTGMGL